MHLKLKQQIVLEYLETKNKKYIANKYNISDTTVTNYTKQLGFKPLSKSDLIPFTKLSTQEIQIIEGLLLGDGGIYPNPKTCNLVIGSVHKDYIEFLQNNLKLLHNKNINMSHRNSREKPFYSCRSKNNKALESFRKNWYKDQKQVPTNFIISPLSLLHWFIGDGTISKNHIQFCTDSFNLDSIQILDTQINSLNIETTITQVKNRRSNGYRINIYKKQSRDLFYNYIGESPTKSFLYKWCV